MALRLQRQPEGCACSACGKAVGLRGWVDDTRPREVFCCPGCAIQRAAPGRLARENPSYTDKELKHLAAMKSHGQDDPGSVFGFYWDGARLDRPAFVRRLAGHLDLAKGNPLYTLEASHLLGVSKPAAYAALRDLEVRGLLVGYAIDSRTGDAVERFDLAGRTRGFVEIQFGAENAKSAREAAEELATFAEAAAAKRVKKRKNPSKKARRAKKAVKRAARYAEEVCACAKCEGLCQGLATGFGKRADLCEYCGSGHRDY